MKKHVLTSLLLGTVLSTAYSQKVEWILRVRGIRLFQGILQTLR